MVCCRNKEIEPEELYQVYSGSFREDVLSEKYLYYLALCAVPPISSVSAVVAEVPEGLPQAEILVDCSKGTYIRALARDLGEALGSGAFLHSLRRTRNGGFSVEQALGIEDLSLIFSQQL